MTFQESIKTCFANIAKFDGRATPSEYARFFVFWCIVAFAAFLLGRQVPSMTILGSIANLVGTLCLIPVGSRRLHDTNRSGWWQLIGLIPLVGFLALIYLFSQKGVEPNRFDSSESPAPSGARPTPATASQPADFDQTLRRLAKLKDEGIISQEEFDQKKKAILAL